MGKRGRRTAEKEYLILVILVIIIVLWVQLHTRLVEAEDIAVPVLYLIVRFSAKRDTETQRDRLTMQAKKKGTKCFYL